MTLSLLGSATWSVLDYVRTNLRTMRLAIPCGDLNDSAMDPPQVAATPPSTSIWKGKRASLEGIIYKCALVDQSGLAVKEDQQARSDHYEGELYRKYNHCPSSLAFYQVG
jgi:hypothetical protein